MTTADLQNLKFDQIKKIQLRWKFDSNLGYFDHRGPAKVEIWPNQEISATLKIWLKFGFFITPDLQNLKFDQIKKFQSAWKFDSNLDFSSSRTCKTWNLTKSRNFSCFENLTQIWPNQENSVALKIWFKFGIFWPPRTCKSWNLTKSRNFSHIKNLTQIWDFLPLQTCKTWILTKSRNFSRIENLTQTWDFLTPQICKT